MTAKEQKRLWLLRLKHKELFCALCGELILNADELSKDHIVPKSKGGPNSPSNYQPAHKRCNSKRGCMTMREWKKFNQKER